MTTRQQLSLTILIFGAPHLHLLFASIICGSLILLLGTTFLFDFLDKGWCRKHDICWNRKVSMTCPLCRAEDTLKERDTKIAELVRKS